MPVRLTESYLRGVIRQELKEMMDDMGGGPYTYSMRKKVYLKPRQVRDASYGGYGGVEKDEKGYYRQEWTDVSREEYDKEYNDMSNRDVYEDHDFRSNDPDFDYFPGDDGEADDDLYESKNKRQLKQRVTRR